MRFIILSILLSLSLSSFAQTEYDYGRKWSFSLSFSNYYSKRMFAVPTTGEDIFNSNRSWGYDFGLGISRTLGKRFELEAGFGFYFKNYKRNLILDVEKIYDLQHSSSNGTQFFNSGFDCLSGEQFSLNLWYKLALEPNSWMIMLGIGGNSPAGESSFYNIYIDQSSGISNAQYLYVYYYTNPKLIFYPVLNVGLGYEYKLWRKSRLRVALQFQYSNTMYFFGQYETTSYAKFEAKGKVYYNPSELGINITYFF